MSFSSSICLATEKWCFGSLYRTLVFWFNRFPSQICLFYSISHLLFAWLVCLSADCEHDCSFHTSHEHPAWFTKKVMDGWMVLSYSFFSSPLGRKRFDRRYGLQWYWQPTTARLVLYLVDYATTLISMILMMHLDIYPSDPTARWNDSSVDPTPSVPHPNVRRKGSWTNLALLSVPWSRSTFASRLWRLPMTRDMVLLSWQMDKVPW